MSPIAVTVAVISSVVIAVRPVASRSLACAPMRSTSTSRIHPATMAGSGVDTVFNTTLAFALVAARAFWTRFVEPAVGFGHDSATPYGSPGSLRQSTYSCLRADAITAALQRPTDT